MVEKSYASSFNVGCAASIMKYEIVRQRGLPKYGTMESAKEYCNRGKVEEWIQLFWRNDGHNIALADGLLKEKRYYTDIVDFDMDLLCDIQVGAPDYLKKENDKVFFFYIVEQMKENMKEWNPPPIIIEYQGNKKNFQESIVHASFLILKCLL